MESAAETESETLWAGAVPKLMSVKATGTVSPASSGESGVTEATVG